MKWYRNYLIIGLVVLTAECAFAAANERTPSQASQSETKPEESDEKIEDLRKSIGKSPNGSKQRLELAQILEKRSDTDGVISTLQPSLKSLGRQELLLLGRAYAKARKALDQVKVMELALAKFPKDYVVITALGEAYSNAGKSDLAIEKFNEAKAINDKYRPANEGLFREFERIGDKYEARNILNDLIKNFGRRPKYVSDLCRIYSSDDYLEKAVEVCQEAVQRESKNEANYIHLGKNLKDLEKPDQAAKTFGKAVKKFPKSVVILTAAADFHVERKNFVEAHKLYRQAVLADEKSAKAMLGYANTSFELQKLNEALEAFIRACKLDRSLEREFRSAFVKLRARKDEKWEKKYEEGMERCL